MDKIEIYKDEKLLDLTKRMVMLDKEEAEFFFSNIEKTSKGRTKEDIARDMILVYEETNNYLKDNYPDNSVAIIWIGTNQFSADILKDKLSEIDSGI